MFNYDNIGGKIKGLAKAAFIVEAISAVLSGFVMVILGIDDFFETNLILYGILTMILGPIVAWVGSWLLYAFGELVENSTSLNRKIPDMAKPAAQQPAATVKPATYLSKPAPRPANTHSWRCDYCGHMTSKSPCEHCGSAELKK